MRQIGRSLLLFFLSGSLALAHHYPSSGREVPVPFPPEASLTGIQHSPDIACWKEECLVIWMSFEYFNDRQKLTYEISGARVSRSGSLLDSSSFTIATAGMMNTSRPQVVALESGYVVFYSGVLVATVSHEGRVLTRDVSLPFSNRLGSGQEAVAAGGSILLYWVENQGPLIPYLTLLDSSLKEIRDIKVDGYPQDVASSDTGFVVASTSLDGLILTRLATDGSARSTSRIPNLFSDVDVAATDDTVLVAWHDAQTTNAPATVTAALITSAGVGPPRILESYVAGDGGFSLDVGSNKSGYLVTWAHGSSEYYTHNIYGQRIASDGRLIDTAPFAVSAAPNVQLHAKSASVDGKYLVAWTDSRFGGGHDHIFGAMIPATGEMGPDFLVSRRVPSQSAPALAATGGVVALTWRESLGPGSGGIMFALALGEGTVLDAAPMGLGESDSAPALASLHDAFVVAWPHSGAVEFAILRTNQEYISRGSIPAHPTRDVSIAASPWNVVLVWEENNTIVSTRIDYPGEIHDHAPHVIGPGSNPRIGFDGSDYWVVYRTGTGAIEGQRLSRDGFIIDPATFTLSTAADSENDRDQLALACGNHTCLALWRTVRDNQAGIDGALVTSGGLVAGISAARGETVEQPSLTFNGESYLLTWSAKETGGDDFDIHAAALSTSANFLGVTAQQPTFRITATDTDERSPAVASPGEEPVFAFIRNSGEGGDRVYLRFSSDGSRRRPVRR